MSLKITGLTTYPAQNFTMQHPEAGKIQFRLYFMPRIGAWFIDIENNDLSIKGVRVHLSINMLSQYRRNISFGLACVSIDEIEPTLLDDFSGGRTELYLLSSAEVQEYAALFEVDT